MRILFIGHLNPGGTCLDRMRSLQRLGHDVTGFDVLTFQSRFRLLRSAQWRWNPSLLLNKLNESIVARAQSLTDISLVWIEKGVWIFPCTLESLKDSLRCALVHYTPDSQLLINRSVHFIQGISLYDHLISTKAFELDDLGRLGARSVMFAPQSYCPVRYLAPMSRLEFQCDVGFISDFKPNYGKVITELVKAVPNVRAWGPRWVRATKRGLVPEMVVGGDGLWGADYVDALCSFKIGLGLLSKYIPEQHTTRSFEIPAAGTFLLAERTAEHQRFFEEGHEAEFFGSHEELISKARFYLTNDLARRRIAEHGRERCHRSGYDMDTVLSKILREVG
jgi:spore maturation protein CgeB